MLNLFAYTAYALTDGLEENNSGGGNDDSAVLAPEFSFDLDTAPMLLIHGDVTNLPWGFIFELRGGDSSPYVPSSNNKAYRLSKG